MRTIAVGTFRGIPVRIHAGALVIAGLVAWIVGSSVLPQFVPGASTAGYLVGGAVAGAGVLGSILAHEAAHAIVARRHGVPVKSITLWLLGGVAHLEDEAPSPRAEAQIAGVGPLTSIVVAATLGGLGLMLGSIGVAPLAAATFLWLALINGVLAVFNLLPGAPLDGGRLLRAWLWKRSGDKDRAAARATSVGRVVGLSVVGLGAIELLVLGNFGGLWTAFIGWFLYGAAGQEARAGKIAAGLGDRRMREVMSPLPTSVPDWSPVADLLAAPPYGASRVLAVDFGGDPSAVVELDQVARLIRTARRPDGGALRIKDLPLASPVEVDGDRPAIEALRTHAGKPVIVTADGRPIGVVAEPELARAVALHHLERQADDDPFVRAA
ncbi:MAG: site-2 protease family protein [Acidimicrobiia bacterium]|nr:site-2 protease family protein [Acidimicrobiia bacterium]